MKNQTEISSQLTQEINNYLKKDGHLCPTTERNIEVVHETLSSLGREDELAKHRSTSAKCRRMARKLRAQYC